MNEKRKSRLSTEALRQFAQLAGVEFTDARLERVLPRVERYLEEVKSLDDVDLNEVEPVVRFSVD